jgi:putative SOS response-associated peptidase YedK
MCYNAAIPRQKELEGLIGPDVLIARWDKHYDSVSAFANPELPVLTAEQPKEVNAFQWGLIPKWCKDEQQAKELRSMTVNAKSESIFEKPSFRNSIMNKRCLIFVNGFYEWREVNKKKYPYYIQLKQQGTFAFGGIYDTWVNTETGELLSTCSIITTAANPLMEMIHNVKKRMPLIFDKDSMLDWIKPNLEKEEINSLMKPFDEHKMKAHTISKLISSRTENPNVPEVKQEFMYPELNVLF